jgi:phosphoglycolate phosphatase
VPTYSADRLIIMDADGTTVDAFSAINVTFSSLGMDIGDVERFQRRRNIFKYLGGLKEFPKNLEKHIKGQKRKKVIDRLTEVYREEARLFDGMSDLINRLGAAGRLRVGIISRNITLEPKKTLEALFKRNGVEVGALDFFHHLPLKMEKTPAFRAVRTEYGVNPAKAYASGDEKRDYQAALQTGMHPFMVSYGFENFDRLTDKLGVPADLISREPGELKERIMHALDILRPEE